jgi:hypothetical protein
MFRIAGHLEGDGGSDSEADVELIRIIHICFSKLPLGILSAAPLPTGYRHLLEIVVWRTGFRQVSHVLRLACLLLFVLNVGSYFLHLAHISNSFFLRYLASLARRDMRFAMSRLT